MTYLLIPSRHIIYSNEQFDALLAHIKSHTYEKVIFAITSYNLNNCKYSPVHIHHRISMVNALITALQKEKEFSYAIEVVPHFSTTGTYVGTVIKHLAYATPYKLSEKNTEVFVYGAYLEKEFRSAGYVTYSAIATDHVTLFRELFVNNNQEFFNTHISPASRRVVENEESLLINAKKIWLDTVLKDNGGITDTRNYHTYTSAMSNEAMIQAKYNDIRAYIREGKIIDEGCADGALFVPIARDFRDSDLVGVEISNDFIARAQERIREGHFGGSFVTILQANLLQPIFEDNFSDTVICNSTTHEIWSYNNKEDSLKHYLSLKYKQLREGGRLIIRDVVGPKDFDRTVLMRSLDDDNQLFRKFMKDFKHLRPEDTYEEVTRGGVQYIKANMKVISEYLLHKDYLDNWESEVQEEFCHLNASSWRACLEGCNFKVVTIAEYRSDWIVKNRFEGQIELCTEEGERVEYPNTNIVIVAEK